MKLYVIPSSILALCLASCASVFNKSTHWVTIRTNLPVDSVKVDNMKVPFKTEEVRVNVTRNEEPLLISLQGKDSVHLIHIKSRNSFNYTMGAIFTAGISIAIEQYNPKRYYYQKNIYISQNDQGTRIFRFAPTPKGSMRVYLSFPYANYYYMATNTGHTNRFGFLGVGTGLDYYYKDNNFLAFQIGGALDNAVGVPVGVDYWGEYEQSNCVFINATQNNTAGSFEFGYGLSASRYYWRKGDTRNAAAYQEKNNTALGFNLNANYRITKNFRVGLLYQPSVFTINNGLKSDYQHFLSAELIFKFKLRKVRG